MYRADPGTFVKRFPAAPDQFQREAEGLQVLAATGLFRIPEIISVSATELVIERIAGGQEKPGFGERFGRKMAALHRVRGKAIGYPTHNYLGATFQRNDPVNSAWEHAPVDDEGVCWSDFFLERRLGFQVELVERNGYGHEFRALLEAGKAVIANLLASDLHPPGLLHGDLWSGNFLVDEHGEPCLIDPAVYYGHREADLAMTRLFGGFSEAFYSAYDEAWPLAPGWEERLHIYQLYHLLNHLNLFGVAYYARCEQILKRYAG